MAFKIRKASRKEAKIKLGLQGPSGSGKTFSALHIAKGLCGDWSKIVVIDTENNSADLYSDLGEYNVLPLKPPFSPERYIEAIKTCEDAGMEVIIIDSVSHEWEGEGGILDISNKMTGNSFTNWGKLTPRHNSFVNAMLQCNAHVICNIRTKQEYVLTEQSRNGRNVIVPQKMGLRGVTGKEMDYELTLVLDLDIKHNATASKDRTGLFADKPEFVPTIETGEKILEWCESGEKVLRESDYIKMIMGAETSERVKEIYTDVAPNDFTKKKGSPLYEACVARNEQLKNQEETKKETPPKKTSKATKENN